MQKVCKHCGGGFEVSEADREFYKKLDLSDPEFCPACRQQRRMSFRNERSLYKRDCDLCKKSMIGGYSADKNFTVFCKECWWGDKWEAEKYGREFDFGRPFFEQFNELKNSVPCLGTINLNDENSGYCSHCYGNKDCYLCYTSDENEQCYYCCYTWKSYNCFDALHLVDSQFCYECVDCVGMYESQFCQFCEAGQGLKFCFDCKNCKDCFGCAGLRHKQYYFFNEQLEKGEYEKRVAEAMKDVEEVVRRARALSEKLPRRALFTVNCEDCVGDYLKNCSNLYHCFDGNEAESSKWMTNFPRLVHHCYDIEGAGMIEWSAECIGCGAGGCNRLFACEYVWNSSYDVFYSSYCVSSHDLFGCVGMRNKQYCILNKSYSKEEYFELREKIVEHMKKTGEWGEFFPTEISAFAYNESVAQEYYPLSEEEILAKGWAWKESEDKNYLPQKYVVPRSVAEVGEEILKEILACNDCGKNYRVIAQELAYLKKYNVGVPLCCPDCRAKRRASMRNPREIWERNCGKCGVGIYTTYAPERPEVVYCEGCYVACY